LQPKQHNSRACHCQDLTVSEMPLSVTQSNKLRSHKVLKCIPTLATTKLILVLHLWIKT